MFTLRASGSVAGLVDCIKLDRVLSSSLDRSTFCVKGIRKPRVKHMEVEDGKFILTILT